MKKLTVTALTTFACISVASSLAYANTYTLSCTNEYSNEQESVNVEASSRSDAIDRTRNEPQYAQYKNCK